MELDANRVAVQGKAATVKWGYHKACELGTWSFVGSGQSGGTVTATIVSLDAFKLTQSPLTLILVVGGASREEILRKAPQLRDVPWLAELSGQTKQVRWPVRSMSTDDGTATIVVGPCERTRE